MSTAPALPLAPLWQRRLRRVEGAPLVALRLWVRGGVRAEESPGEACLAGRLLAEGTRRRDWRQLADEAEGRGMVVHGLAGFEGHGLAIDALATDWERAIDQAAELLLDSTFPADRFDLLRRQAAAELESQADQADLLTGREFTEQLYSPHPRGRPLQGSAEALARLGPDQPAAFHRRALGWGGAIAVAGAIDPDAVARRLAELVAALPPAGPLPPEPPPPPTAPPARRRVATRASDQAHLFLGHLTVDRHHPDLPALELLGVVLGSGAGLTGRIPTRIREREGLAYSASADAAAGAARDPGRLTCYVGTSPETVGRAEAAAREELARLAAEGPTAEETEGARAWLLGREPFRRETARQWADLLAAAALAGQPFDDPAWLVERWRAVTHEGLREAARRHVRPDRLVAAVGLPAAG